MLRKRRGARRPRVLRLRAPRPRRRRDDRVGRQVLGQHARPDADGEQRPLGRGRGDARALRGVLRVHRGLRGVHVQRTEIQVARHQAGLQPPLADDGDRGVVRAEAGVLRGSPAADARGRRRERGGDADARRRRARRRRLLRGDVRRTLGRDADARRRLGHAGARPAGRRRGDARPLAEARRDLRAQHLRSVRGQPLRDRHDESRSRPRQDADARRGARRRGLRRGVYRRERRGARHAGTAAGAPLRRRRRAAREAALQQAPRGRRHRDWLFGGAGFGGLGDLGRAAVSQKEGGARARARVRRPGAGRPRARAHRRVPVGVRRGTGRRLPGPRRARPRPAPRDAPGPRRAHLLRRREGRRAVARARRGDAVPLAPVVGLRGPGPVRRALRRDVLGGEGRVRQVARAAARFASLGRYCVHPATQPLVTTPCYRVVGHVCLVDGLLRRRRAARAALGHGQALRPRDVPLARVV
mmetsp:Transcript_9540/g.29719  ORF Transcript_9540/g.29719 Transcript_9540/m.29719 type:complete len:471 (+) Transcript_9540:2010-3422(+)